MSLLPQISLDAADIERKLFDVEHEGEKDFISELSVSARDRSNEAGTNDEVNREREHSGGSLSLAGESSSENKAGDSLRQDGHLQPLFSPEVKKDEVDPGDETGSTEKAVSVPDVNSLGDALLGNNVDNNSIWSQDNLLPPFPLLDIDEEEPSETNDGEKLEDNLHQAGFGDEVKAVGEQRNVEVTKDENDRVAIFEKVDNGQTIAQNVSEQKFPQIDATGDDGKNGSDNDTEDKQVMNGSEEREGHLAADIIVVNNVGEDENGTTDLLPILTMGIEDEDEREKNETTSDNSIESTGSGSSVSFEVGSGEEGETEEGGSDADLSQEFLFDDSADSSVFNSSQDEDEEPDPGYLLPLFQLEEESETLIGRTATEPGVLFETEQTEGDVAEEKFSSNTLSVNEVGMNVGVVKDPEDPVADKKPDSLEVGVAVGNLDVAVTENDFLALQDGHQLPSEEKDHNKEYDGSEFHTISSVTPVFEREDMDVSAKVKEDEEDGTVFSDSLAGLDNLDSEKILNGLDSEHSLEKSVYLDIQNIDKQGERHSGKSQGTSYLLPKIEIKYIGENSSLHDSYDESYATEEDYILSEESFGDASLQNAHRYELKISKVDYDYEGGEEYDSGGGQKRDQVSEEKDEKLFASESLLPELKSLPASETHLSSGWEEVETKSKNDEESAEQDDGGSEEGSRETALVSEEKIHSKEAELQEGDSFREENPQNYRRPCIPYLGNHGEARIVTPILFVSALTVLALQ